MKKEEHNARFRDHYIAIGIRISYFRKLRGLSQEQLAERAGISRSTLWKVENGNPSVAVGIYAAVLHALNNMDKDLLKIAGDDELGRKLQDIELLRRGKRQ